ncbi:hypothetical protein [Shewanella septentrionalis]|uniref:Uncharacterized protein n=1 Tax=Shewanella septentrionalis TaxID=2952223 RepID=A0A9X2WR30_9GAMM|nr:hypothetical protein [Shewanella septentrionalis]MCT7943987.1 hypothetical protein [Shewanella septentrionalis]
MAIFRFIPPLALLYVSPTHYTACEANSYLTLSGGVVEQIRELIGVQYSDLLTHLQDGNMGKSLRKIVN